MPQFEELKILENIAFHAVVPNLYKMEEYGIAIYNCMLAILALVLIGKSFFSV